MVQRDWIVRSVVHHQHFVGEPLRSPDALHRLRDQFAHVVACHNHRERCSAVGGNRHRRVDLAERYRAVKKQARDVVERLARHLPLHEPIERVHQGIHATGPIDRRLC